ncbi:MAG: hypothetical protein ACR2PL_27420 [Dehalococcoidia bacterium]
MISTVTTATVSSVTTAAGFAAALGLMAVLLLIGFLAARELAGTEEHPRLRRLSGMLNVAIVPLLMVFGAIVLARVVQAL